MREILKSTTEVNAAAMVAGGVGTVATEHLVGVDPNTFNPGVVEEIGGIKESTLGHSGNGGDGRVGYHIPGKQPDFEVQFN